MSKQTTRAVKRSGSPKGLRDDRKSTAAAPGAGEIANVVAQPFRAPLPRGSKTVVAQPFRAADSLRDRVAVVAGATRGAGRGIARALGEAGAIVYCTGRSVDGHPSPYGRPETIDETARLIGDAGGTAIAVRVDHTVEAEVEALFARIDREHGRLDVLVNCIAGEEPMMAMWGAFWKTSLANADAILRQALVSHIITAKHAAPLMIAKGRGLIVEVTEGDFLSAGGNPLTQTVKLALKGLALNMAAELKPHGVAAVAIVPGYLRSETMLERMQVTEATWRDAGKTNQNFLASESPLFVGRAVAALAADDAILERTGQLWSSWELARAYGFTDADGSRPDWGAVDIDFSRHPPVLVQLFRDSWEIQLEWLNTLSKRTKRFLSKLPPQGVAAALNQPPPRLRRSAVASAKAEGLGDNRPQGTRARSKALAAQPSRAVAKTVVAQPSKAVAKTVAAQPSRAVAKTVVAQPFRAAPRRKGRR